MKDSEFVLKTRDKDMFLFNIIKFDLNLTNTWIEWKPRPPKKSSTKLSPLSRPL